MPRIPDIGAYYEPISSWLNTNEGVLGLAIFCISAIFAWFSGIISGLRKAPRLLISTIDGPTVCVVRETGRVLNGNSTHRTCVSLYLHITNAGSAPTSLGNISLGYKWPMWPLSGVWWRQIFFHHWIRHECVALEDFQTPVGTSGSIKVYPFLTQAGFISGKSANSYLEIGTITNGVAYFEDREAWGGWCRPIVHQGYAKFRVRIRDAFGKAHSQTLRVKVVELSEARKFNPRFGDSLECLAGHDVNEVSQDDCATAETQSP